MNTIVKACSSAAVATRRQVASGPHARTIARQEESLPRRREYDHWPCTHSFSSGTVIGRHRRTSVPLRTNSREVGDAYAKRWPIHKRRSREPGKARHNTSTALSFSARAREMRPPHRKRADRHMHAHGAAYENKNNHTLRRRPRHRARPHSLHTQSAKDQTPKTPQKWGAGLRKLTASPPTPPKIKK